MARHRKSLTYNNASMPYAMRVHQGIFIHQGNTSRPFASHGCIRLDENNARDLFNMVRAQKRVGNQVDVIIRGTDPRR